MTVFIIRRILQSVVVLFVMSFLVFSSVNLVGDPVEMMVSDEADQAERDRVIKSMGLDKPWYTQYGLFVVNAFKGDLGNSFVYGEPALQIIVARMPATFELALVSLFMSVVIGIPLGVWAGLFPDKISSKIVMSGSILGFSLPTFWVGLMMIMVFAVMLGWLPSTGRGDTVEILGIDVSFLSADGLSHLFLPALNLALFNTNVQLLILQAQTQTLLLKQILQSIQRV